jgi:hypothetical protein
VKREEYVGHVLDKCIGKEDRREERDRFEVGEEKSELVIRNPTNNDKKGYDKGGDLLEVMHAISGHSSNDEHETHDGATNTNADRQFHLTFHGHPHRCDVFSCIGLWKGK